MHGKSKFQKFKQCTFLCGPVGIWALAAVVWKSEKYLQKVLQWETKAKETKSNELLFGKAGYVAALLFLRDNLEFEREEESNPKRGWYYNSDRTDDYNCMTQNEMSQLDIELRLGKKNYKKVINAIRRISKTILMEGEETKKDHLVWKWHKKEYLGAAHGTAGILSILFAAEFRTEKMFQTVTWLTKQRLPSGNYPTQPNYSSNEDELVQWCHGAPGMGMLFAQLAAFLPKRSKKQWNTDFLTAWGKQHDVGKLY